MNVLLVYAHPEPRSLNGSLKEFAIKHLRDSGHVVEVSDLYAMQWKAVLDADDNTAPKTGERFDAVVDSKRAFTNKTQAADIAREQERLRRADAIILQFPLWWFSMPAILKGWVDRVFANGFGYGLGDYNDKHFGDRYGEGTLTGKRGMLVVTTGGWEPHYGPRGVHGPIEDLLFPIQHGLLFYTGIEALPPFVICNAGRVDEARYAETRAALGQRLDDLWTTPPVAFRKQNGGDYLIPQLTLRPDLLPGQSGLHLHIKKD